MGSGQKTAHSAWSPTVIGETMKSLSVALLFVLLATATAVPAPRVGDCAAADDYIDEVLANVAKMVVEQGYDPAELPGDDVHANIGLRDARAGYHVAAEFQGIEVGASAEAKIDSIDIYFEASMALSGEGGLQLGRFEITNVGHIDVSVSGLGPLDWILGKLVGAIADTIKGFIIPLIEGPIRDILQNIINGMMPPTAAVIMQ